MDFKQVDKKYRPIPFWSWNERLSTEMTREQVRLMNDAGIGGYFMHARGGLLTEYMGEEWFDNVHAACDEGGKLGMHSWAYDENGWPSGFGGGKVNGLGVEYQQKSLHAKPYAQGDEGLENTIAVIDGRTYYYSVNEFYVDVLDPKVIAEFIKVIYEEYKTECKDSFEGFFTDEPQILRGSGFPWSFILEEEFTKRYGYSLIGSIDRLFVEKDDSYKVRVDYWQLVTELFSSSFFKQIYDWCEENGYKLTGHLVMEESLLSQLICNGSCMAHYEYFHIPGMDWLARPVFPCLTPMQVSSAAAQTGKKQILSETFALAGHNVSHNELKRIYEWQMVHGINLLCTHLEGYSLRGIRKRDYPPAMYYQQPWWDDMHLFFDAMSRIGMLLAEGEICADTLLLHPQTTAWKLYNGAEYGYLPGAFSGVLNTEARSEINRYHDLLLRDMRTLEDKHVGYHLGDETVIARHGRIEGKEFVVGNMRYTTLVIPENLGFLPFTEQLISEFRAAGGRIVSATEVAADPIMPTNRLSYTKRSFPDFKMHYIVNTDDSTVTSTVNVQGQLLVPHTGELVPFGGSHTFAPYESIVVIEGLSEGEKTAPVSRKTEKLDLGGIWQVKNSTYNSLTLDKCDYSFDGELVEENGYVLNILPRINELEREVRLEQTYRFTIDAEPPKELLLATETPDLFEITLNGQPINKTDKGFFRDSAFRLLDISYAAKRGENLLVLRSSIKQTDGCYEHISKSWAFESMKNCLSYDVEIEPVYIVGDFDLALPERIEELDKDAYRIFEQPVIVEKHKSVDISRLDFDGYSQFSGTLTLEKTVNVTDTKKHVTLVGRGMNSLRIAVNGVEVATKLYAPYDVDITDYLKVGENTLTLTILNNLRNMMGPHHLKIGESYSVVPGSFYKESNVFNHPHGANASCHDVLDGWDDNYCFVHFGI